MRRGPIGSGRATNNEGLGVVEANYVAGNFGTIGGGSFNSALAYGATIGGGTDNTAGGGNSTVAGGGSNHANGNTSTVAGGGGNSAGGTESTVGGGDNNIANGNVSTISGGEYSSATADHSTISGGANNQATSSYATVPGGDANLASGLYSFAAGFHAQATNNGAFVWSDGTGTTTPSFANNQFMARASGGVVFLTSTATAPTAYGGSGAGVALSPNGTSWSTISDRNAKKNFQAVDTEAVLDKLAAIPVQQWNYKWEKDGDVPNVGPMAQDFKHAFYPGRDDKSISTLEFDGVELAAIQGLNQRLKEKDAEISQLQKSVAELKAMVLELAETRRENLKK